MALSILAGNGGRPVRCGSPLRYRKPGLCRVLGATISFQLGQVLAFLDTGRGEPSAAVPQAILVIRGIKDHRSPRGKGLDSL